MKEGCTWRGGGWLITGIYSNTLRGGLCMRKVHPVCFTSVRLDTKRRGHLLAPSYSKWLSHFLYSTAAKELMNRPTVAYVVCVKSKCVLLMHHCNQRHAQPHAPTLITCPQTHWNTHCLLYMHFTVRCLLQIFCCIMLQPPETQHFELIPL